MALNIEKEIHNEAIIYAKDNIVYLEGEIDQTDPDRFLVPFFKNIILQMEEMVYIDVRKLEYLNSAGIECILEFIINRKPGTKIVIKIDKLKNWQKGAVDVIKSLDEKHISLLKQSMENGS